MDEEKDLFSEFRVIISDQGQYSIWPAERDLPVGWQGVGKVGTREQCLAYIKRIQAKSGPRGRRAK